MVRDPACNMEVDETTGLSYEMDGEKYYFCSEGCRDKFIKEKSSRTIRDKYELIIIGGGPAGLTAAVYAATLKIDTFLITKEIGGQAIDSTKIKNYMGFDFITGPELAEKFNNQLIHSNYVSHLIDEVERIDKTDEGFKVITSGLAEYKSKTLILATGMTRKKLSVPGEETFQRKGVFYGNIQDYSFIQGQDIAIIGGGNSAIQLVDNLHNIAGTVNLISDFGLSADPKDIERINSYKNLHKYEHYTVEEFRGDDTLSNIRIREKAGEESQLLSAKGAFISIGLQANSGLVTAIVDRNEKDEIEIKSDCSTSCPGLFAAGDVTDAFGKRIIIASGEGAKASLAARKYLLEKEK